MGLALLMARNARRSPLRGSMTALAVAVSLVAFILLRAVSAGWTERVEQTPNNRVITRHKLSWDQTVPLHYAQVVRELPGVQYAAAGRWAGVKLPGDSPVFFESFAVQPEPFIQMHYELVLPEEQKLAFLENRQGILVSATLAKELGWKLGSRVQLEGRDVPGRWQVDVVGIYESTRHGFAHRTVWLRWDYFNESLGPADRDRLGFISAQIFDPNQGASIARAIDIHFDTSDPPTFSQEDQALHASLVGQFGALLDALNLIGILILGVIVLVLGNTIAMSVSERTKEYGALRAIGFLPRHLAVLVLGEAAALGLAGGALGVVLSYPLVESSMSRFLQENLDFAPLRVPPGAVVMSLALGVALALVAASLPAHRVAHINVTEALRHVA